VAVTALPDLTYGAMRLRWCRLALLAFVKRWAIYLVVAVAVLAGGVVGFVTFVMAAAAWLVLPLFYAAAHGAWLLPALLLQALMAAAAVWGLRTALWPVRWAEAERALPIAAVDTWRSDLHVVLIALLPLLLLQALGAAALLGQNLEWLRPFRGRAVLALLLACGASWLLGAAVLQRMRRPPTAGVWPPRWPTAVSLVGQRAALHWAVVLLWWPLWRGPARRTGQALLWGTAVLLLPALAIACTHLGVGWWLAALALLSMLVSTRINSLARDELLPLLLASAMLPLRLHRVQRLRASLAVWPVLLALLLTSLVLTFEAGCRPLVWLAFVLALVVSVLVEVAAAPAAASAAQAKAARWLFLLVLCVCLASEVMQ
jgi:hypothetical protein